MTWAATKLAVKKAWAWTKNYWYVPALLAYTLTMWIFFRRPADAALGVLSASNNSYKKQMDVLQKTHEEEAVKKEKIIKKYKETIENLENTNETQVVELDKEKKKRVKELVEKSYNDEEDLAKQLSKMLGVTYVPRKDKK